VLHSMSPLMHDRLNREFAKSGAGPDDAQWSMSRAYMQAQSRYCSLGKTLVKLCRGSDEA
jgi:hypothetical protein